jgi:hypothetical protein
MSKVKPHLGQRTIVLALGMNFHSTEHATNFKNVTIFFCFLSEMVELRHVRRKRLLARKFVLWGKENVKGDLFAYRKLEATCVSFEEKNRFCEG